MLRTMYKYFMTRQPSPGNMAAAFQMPTTLPIVETDGPGIRVFWDFRPTQPPQVYQTKTAPSTGFGGLISNGVVFAPLLDDKGFPAP